MQTIEENEKESENGGEECEGSEEIQVDLPRVSRVAQVADESVAQHTADTLTDLIQTVRSTQNNNEQDDTQTTQRGKKKKKCET